MRTLLSPRVIAVLVLLAGALYINTNFIAQHQAPNAFVQLFTHLMPAPLIVPGSDHAGGHEHVATHATTEPASAQPNGAAEHAAAPNAAPAAAATSPKHLIEIPLPGFLKMFDMNGERVGAQLLFTNLQLFQVLAVLLMFVCLSGVPRYLYSGRGDVVTKLFAGFAHWIRDDVVYPVMGKELGARWLPYFLAIFFFVLFMNLAGLVPFGATATASIFVTAAMAAFTLTCMLVFGMWSQGPVRFWKSLVPECPTLMWPFLFPIEVMGLFLKPMALMIRLFATMMGGHLVVLTFIGLILYMGQEIGRAVGWSVAPLAVTFAVFIMIIEAFVAMLQAYIFTQLSVIFISTSIHPDH